MKRSNYLAFLMLLMAASFPLTACAYSISQDGLRFIAEHEGTEYNLYNDPAGHCTIGTGHLVHTGNCDGIDPSEKEFLVGITEDQSLELLREDVAIAEQAVNSQVTVPLTQSQFDANVDFTYNMGAGNLEVMLSDSGLNEGNYTAVPEELNRWIYGGGEIQPGLVTRRGDEGELFKSESLDTEESAPTVKEFFKLNWNNNGHYYQVAEKTMNWDDAKAYAESQQITDPDTGVIYRGYLATITSLEENSWVFQNIISPLNVQNCAWLGGYREEGYDDKPSEGWHWVTGEPWSWTNWDDSEPNNWNNVDERYLAISTSDFRDYKKGMWNDLPITGLDFGHTDYLLIEYEPITQNP